MNDPKFHKPSATDDPPYPPLQRKQPLPWSEPKSNQEDPNAPERVRRIMASPSYRRADCDLDFLQRDEVRPSRLQLEFLKPEVFFEEQGVGDTIVVFGGTRIVEPAVARLKVEQARQALEQNPRDPTLQNRLAVSERILAKSHYYEVARELGRIVGRAGQRTRDCRLIVITGGGPGLMEAANRGAYEVGAKSAGLNIALPYEQFPNPYITPELCFQFRYFGLRKMHFMMRAKALVAFPGGYGTLDELFGALCLIQTRKIKPLPVVLVGEQYWRRVFDVEYLAAEGTIDPEDTELFCFAETADQIWKIICEWYEQIGEQLIP
ncbi:MAG: LOG family protein [Pseudomonadota bacterium]|nr:LOG family protein [Pseudomonadota bacterium]